MSAQEHAPRFIVGIDLGTTNCAVAYVDTGRPESERRARMLSLPQLIAPGETEARETLPSFHYHPAPTEFREDSLRLPWENNDKDKPRDYFVGVFAREHGAQAPGRLIHSAKSWLSHSGVDRVSELLPWHGAPEVKRISPAEASARYLRHLREAWNHRHPEHPLEAQDVVITIPASFDEVARELTVSAAQRAGLPRIVLLEEPQAAFYAWLQNHSEQAWSEMLRPGDKILVCDIGGGTSDFTLIQVRRDASQKGAERIRFHRIAVGEHLILGGDNLDLALAHYVEQRLGKKLEPRQWSALIRRCQQVKETLLGPGAPERLTVSIAAAGGAKLIGGATPVELTRDEVVGLLVDGFLPRVPLDALPAKRASGFQEFGLPFAPDPAITRYLAAFLSENRGVASEFDDASSGDRDNRDNHHNADRARPDAILFNGGLFESSLMRERLLEVVRSWFSQPGRKAEPWQPLVLENERLDFAVAIGAARYGLARRGTGTRVSGGLPRAYYIGVQHGPGLAALCLVPAGLEEGQTIDLPGRKFDLLVRQPAEFPLFVSSARTIDRPGDVLPLDETHAAQLRPLPPIRTALQTKDEQRISIPVTLHARVTEIGTLEVWCSEMGGPRRWKLQFDVRAATRTDLRAHDTSGERAGFVEEETTSRCRALLRGTFGGAAGDPAHDPEGLVKRLETSSGMSRWDWPPSLLRDLWQELMNTEPGRQRTAMHEARWLSLLGFSLRPGYGFAVDDWRVAQTWRLYERRVEHARNELCRAEWWILWRRIAGGLRAGQQRAIAEPRLVELRKSSHGRGRQERGTHELAELWRMLASFELLDPAAKTAFGETLLEMKLPASQSRAAVWALGRLGARVPFYGPINNVLPVEIVERWIAELISTHPTNKASAAAGEDLNFALMQMARRTDDRFRDVSDATRERTLRWLRAAGAPTHHVELVKVGGTLGEQEANTAFGETLPHGLRVLA